MSSIIRQLEEQELALLATLSVNAFSSNGQLEEAEKGCNELFEMLHNNVPEQHIYGIFREEQLVGGMRMIDYKMNVRNKIVDIGGVAGVVTDLIHKKERIAKELIEYFIRYYRDKGSVMTVLYPFKAGFYRKMGFGLGTEIREYRIKPRDIPGGSSKTNLVYMDAKQAKHINECYKNFASKRNGMTIKTGLDFFWLFYEGSNRIVAYKENDVVKGYISFTFKKEDINSNNIIINEFVYTSKAALMSLCTFLHDQADQIDNVIIKTQDENLYYIFDNPSNGSHMLTHDMSQTLIGQVAVGMMYRVINTKKLFEVLDYKCFGDFNCKIKLSITDNFIKENNEDLVLHFIEGKVKIVQEEAYDVEVKLDIDNFSSMLMGAVSFSRLYSLGLAEIDNEEYLERISKIFSLDIKPMCVSVF